MKRLALLAAGTMLGGMMLGAPALAKPFEMSDAQLDTVTAGADFGQSNLVSDQAGQAATTDPNLVNPWGVAQSPTGPLWVANNGTGTTTLYSNAGVPQPLVVSIPGPSGGAGLPTGAVFNAHANDFIISNGGIALGSDFLFATENATIAGWNPQVSPTSAVIAVDNSATGAVYKGLTIARVGNSERLYVADFGLGRVDVFDSQFHPLGSFRDPSLPPGFAPFDIQAINGRLFVSFAQQQADHFNDAPGPGNGFIDVFNTNGTLVRHLVARGQLNSPWGMTIAPPGFGQFGGALLVGNFGDGRINAYNPVNGHFLGTVDTSPGHPLTIDGLWSLHPGQGASGKVVFTAGPNGEKNGLLGTIQPVPTTATATATATAGKGTAAATAKGFPPAATKAATAAMTAAANATHH